MIESTYRVSGIIDKMQAHCNKQNQIQYQLPIGEELIGLNDLIGKTIHFSYGNNIYCMHCGTKTKKSFAQGFCYLCMQRLAQCDRCIMQPELCHYDQGTCREPDWAQDHCMIEHVVYLANSSGMKVGITRNSQIPTRWIDQGAVQAVPVIRVSQRKLSGLIEHQLKQWINDKTNWRTMLKGEVGIIDFISQWQTLKPHIEALVTELQQQYGIQAVDMLDEKIIQDSIWEGLYPVSEYPTKIVSKGFDKESEISGKLMGIKGQYLLLDCCVLNIRKHRGYQLTFNYSAG